MSLFIHLILVSWFSNCMKQLIFLAQTHILSFDFANINWWSFMDFGWMSPSIGIDSYFFGLFSHICCLLNVNESVWMSGLISSWHYLWLFGFVGLGISLMSLNVASHMNLFLRETFMFKLINFSLFFLIIDFLYIFSIYQIFLLIYGNSRVIVNITVSNIWIISINIFWSWPFFKCMELNSLSVLLIIDSIHQQCYHSISK